MPIGFQLRASTLAFSPAMRIAFACVLFGSASLLRSVSAYEGGSNAAPTKSTSDGDLKASFDSTVLPFFQKYCMDCHDTATAEAKLDVSVFRTPSDIHGAWGSWQAILSRVHEGEMPPADSSDQPTTEERRGLEAWSEKFRISEAARRAGDPGPISTRRLSNSEYNYTIRDLTGVDIQPTASFPSMRRIELDSITLQNRSPSPLLSSASIWMRREALPTTCCSRPTGFASPLTRWSRIQIETSTASKESSISIEPNPLHWISIC